MTSAAPPQSTLRRKLLLTGIVYFILYVAWVIWGRSNLQERVLLGNLAMFFTAVLAAFLAFAAFRRSVGTPVHTAWGALFAGLALWAASDGLRMGMQVYNPDRLFALSPLDALYLGGALCLLAGLLVYPRQPRRDAGRLRLMFDATLTTTAMVTLAWLLVLRPMLATQEQIPATLKASHPYAVVYPLLDLLILIVLINLLLISDARATGPFGLISAGILAYLFSDLAYAYVLIYGRYTAGQLADIGWVLGDLLLALAGFAQILPGEFSHHLFRRIVPRLQALLPLVLAVMFGWYALFEWQLYGIVNALAFWVTVILGLGLIARQGLIIGEVEFQQYASLVNSVAEPTFICDSQGRLQLVNPALLAATGYESERDLLGQPVQQLLHPADEATRSIQVAQLPAKQSLGWSGELNLQRSDGRLIPVSLALRPIFSGQTARLWRSEKLALAGTAHDLSEQKRQQAALQLAYEQITAARDQLEQLNTQLEQKVDEKTASLIEAYRQLEQQNRSLQELDRLKSDFVSLVSHELRAPLTNIAGGIELMLASQRTLPLFLRETLDLVQAEIGRLTRFVETILDLSALDAGRMPLFTAPLQLQGVVQTLQTQMRHLPGSERVVWQVPADLPLLLADDQALISVLFHLLDNAFKYAPEGQITVEAGRVDGMAFIRVADAGPGIPEEVLPMLFERFYRHNPSDAQTVYGHGLGLYIVQRLLQAMGGKIEVANRPEGGACFTCWLPLEITPDCWEE